MNSMSDDLFKEMILKFLQTDFLDKEKILYLNDCLSEAFNLNRMELVTFLIGQLEKFRKLNKEKSIKTELTSPRYQLLSLDEKISYWAGGLHTIMRNQVESGFDEYSIFTVDWYNNIKKHEPDFEHILSVVFSEKLGNHWSKSEVLKRIGK